jgi:hypothetical protein
MPKGKSAFRAVVQLDCIDALLWQQRIVFFAEHDANVCKVFSFGPLVDVVQISAIDIHGINGAASSHTSRRPNGEPTGSGANIGYSRSFLDSKDVHDPIGLKSFVTLWIFEDRKLARVWLTRRPIDRI